MDYIAEIAFKIVTMILKIKPEQVVSLSGEIQNSNLDTETLAEIPLIEELALMIRKKKAFPVIELSTEKLRKRFFTEIPEDILTVPMTYYSNWITSIDSFIDIGWRNNPEFYNTIPDHYFNRMRSSINKVWDLILQKKKRLLFLGFPTSAMADYYQLDYAQIKKSYFAGLNCDYYQLKKTASQLTEDFKDSKSLLLTNDQRVLSFDIDNTTIKAFNGEFEDDTTMILPTGKWECRILRDSLHGIFFVERVYYENERFEDIQVVFEHGKMMSVDFVHDNKNNNLFRNAMMRCIDNVLLTIGCNENLTLYSGYHLFDECAQKAVSLKFFDDHLKTIQFTFKQADLNEK